MDRYKPVASASEECVESDATSVAKSVQQDFSALIAIFDRHLDGPIESDAKSAISEAKAAAERGLRLSQRLIELVRDSNSDG